MLAWLINAELSGNSRWKEWYMQRGPTMSRTQEKSIVAQSLILLTTMSETTSSPVFFFYRKLTVSWYLGPITWENMTPLFFFSFLGPDLLI